MKRFLALLVAATGILHAQTKPNIIFVLVDDMGWGDLGVTYQNSRNFAANRNAPAFATPNLDAMAAEGIQLRRHYCPAPVCAPSRASLLLGVHQGHANVRDNQFDKALEDNHTLGTVMKGAGYSTAMIGKYGLQGSGLPAPARPQLRGFDYFFGYLEHGDAHYHYPKETGANVYDGTTDVVANLDKCYSTDLIAARSKKWLIDHRAATPGQPFFLYLAFTAPHARLDVPTQAYPAGRGVAGGIQWIGTPGNMINTAGGTINSWIHPDYASATYDNDNNSGTAEVAWPDYAKRHATMIRRLDDAVADLLQTLKDLNIDGNTLVVFTSDNGPHNEAGTGGSFTFNPTFFDSFGPMDGIKRDTWEGGMREPTIVRWPGQIPAGAISNSPSQFQDWMPTLSEAAGVPAPARADGVSLMPTLKGLSGQRASIIYVEYQYSGSTPSYTEFETSRRGATRGQEQVIHLDGYKGIRYNVGSSADDFRIYDTLADAKETTNLAGTNPYFTALQQRMKDRVLQVRRSGGGVSRPYDTAQVPPVTVTPVKPGLKYSAYEGVYPWVPDFTGSTASASGETTTLTPAVRTRDNDIGLSYQGYLQVPADGDYTFYLTTDTGAFVRLHDTQLIDADYGYAGGTEKSSGTIPLKAGLHPIRVHYRHAAAAGHTLSLQWQGPGIAKQTVPAGNLLTEGAAEPSPPTANDDTATTAYQTSALVDVLANDTDDGTPSPLSIGSIGTPNFGTAVPEAGKIRYTPPAGFSGVATFTYTASDGADSDTATVTVTVAVPPATKVNLWTTTFTGADGSNRNPVNTNGDSSFTDTLIADDANLTFQDASFSGTVFMHSGNMAAGTYYSPRTNVDNPGATGGQNGGWWQSEFRYTGGSQTINLSDVVFRMVWSNSSGNLQAGDSSVRDITLTAEYSVNGGTSWTGISPPQTYNLTVNPGTTAEQHQNRTFTFGTPLAISHATQDLWLRVRAENAGATAGAYVDVQSITFQGNVPGPSDDYAIWSALFPAADLTHPAEDADHDGRTNFEEYAFGLDPTDGSSVSAVTTPDRATGTFSYTRRKQSLTVLAYTYKSSTTLGGWTAFTPPAPVVSNNGDPVETITVTIPNSLLTEPKLFLRVEATAP
ncbi:MAG: sulfatase-like hydrolase/transferase [Verrucomicrobia bacterium]|nr:sulfatase-like hydrolase/transferase [Verrucomicrobiota bacterium]